MEKSKLLSPPDGDVIGTLSDTRVLATAAGVALGALLERAIFKGARKTFGTATLNSEGHTVIYAVKEDGSADTSAPAPKLGLNRQLARAAVVVGSVAAIEASDSGEVQYFALGVASLELAHMVQAAFPGLNS